MDKWNESELGEILKQANPDIKLFEEILYGLREHVIPESYAQFEGNILSRSQLDFPVFFIREDFMECSGCALIAYDWVRPLAAWIKDSWCLEVMCGCGSLSYALKNCGTNIIATDDFSWKNYKPSWFNDPWLELEQLDAVSAVQKYGKQVNYILMSWPYVDHTAYEVLMEMRLQNPETKLIFIGEYGGATADEAFFKEAHIVEDRDFYRSVAAFRQHAGMNDRVFLFV